MSCDESHETRCKLISLMSLAKAKIPLQKLLGIYGHNGFSSGFNGNYDICGTL